MDRRRFSRGRKGFTLVELLVVIAIIGILVALLLPAIQAAREASRRTSCQNKIRQLGLGLHEFHDVHNKFPPGASENVFPNPNPFGNTTTFVLGTSWIVHILPHIEQKAIYDQYNFQQSYNSASNWDLGDDVITTLYCPSGPDPKRYTDPNGPVANRNVTTHYYGVMGPGGPTDNFTIITPGNTYTYRYGNSGGNGAWSFHGILSHYRESTGSISTNRVVRMSDVIDGTANSFMLGEISKALPVTIPGTTTTQPNQYRTWIRGNNGGSGTTKNLRYPLNSTFYNGSNNFNEISFASDHGGDGVQFVMADASVKFVQEGIDLSVLMMVSSMNCNEPVSLDAVARQ